MIKRRLVRYRMPDGKAVFGLPGSSAELRFIHQEVFVEEIYTAHGIVIRDGDCVLDVGANVGLFTTFVSERARQLRILAFEPVPPIFAALTANVEAMRPRCRDRDQTLRLFNHGLSDRDVELEITYYPRMPGNSTLFPELKPREARAAAAAFRLRDIWRLDKFGCLALLFLFPLRRPLVRHLLERRFRQGQRHRIRVRRLSEVLSEEGVDRIDLLKVDVEAAEFDVLNGLSELDWARIQQFVMEVAPSNVGRVPALVNELRRRGFDLVTVDSFRHGGTSLNKDRTKCELALLPQTVYARRL